jgi:hypothetical protein
MVEFAKNFPIRGNVTSGMDQILDKPRARVVATVAQSIPNSTATKISFNTGSQALDSDGFWDTNILNRVTIRTSGFYAIVANIRWALASAGFQRDAWLQKTGDTTTKYGLDTVTFPSANVSPVNNISYQMVLAAGDYLELMAFQDSGGLLNTSTGGGDSVSSELMLCLIST